MKGPTEKEGVEAWTVCDGTECAVEGLGYFGVVVGDGRRRGVVAFEEEECGREGVGHRGGVGDGGTELGQLGSEFMIRFM